MCVCVVYMTLDTSDSYMCIYILRTCRLLSSQIKQQDRSSRYDYHLVIIRQFSSDG